MSTIISDDALMQAWLELCGTTVFDGFDNRMELAAKFEIDIEQTKGVLVALYGQGSYEGSAYVLLTRGGKLYEISASHCSCHGVEGQWEEEPTTIEAVRKRDYSSLFDAEQVAKIGDVLDFLEAHHHG